MLKRVFFGVLAALAVPLTAQAAQVNIVNDTGACAWVTIYTAELISPWRIVGGEHGHPRFVKPHDRYMFSYGNEPELKVRAEVMEHPTCGGRHIADTYDVRKGSSGGATYATLVKHGDKYFLWFPK